MENITSITDLKTAIKELEYKQAREWPALKEDFRTNYEKFKPMNILKNTFKEVVSSPEIKNNAIKAAIGFTAGIIVKKVLLGKLNNPLTKIIGTAIETTTTAVVVNSADKIKSIGTTLISKIVNLATNSKKIK
jgi:hypothetical protein